MLFRVLRALQQGRLSKYALYLQDYAANSRTLFRESVAALAQKGVEYTSAASAKATYRKEGHS